jgi:hypothetical protein
MNPPSVYDVASPSSQSTRRMTKIVQSIANLLLFQFTGAAVRPPMTSRRHLIAAPALTQLHNQSERHCLKVRDGSKKLRNLHLRSFRAGGGIPPQDKLMETGFRLTSHPRKFPCRGYTPHVTRAPAFLLVVIHARTGHWRRRLLVSAVDGASTYAKRRGNRPVAGGVGLYGCRRRNRSVGACGWLWERIRRDVAGHTTRSGNWSQRHPSGISLRGRPT